MSLPAHRTTSLTLLVPTSVLPGEAEDTALDAWDKPAHSVADLFRDFQSLATPRTPKFFLTGNDIEFGGDLEDESTLRLLELSADEGSGAPSLAPRMATSHFDWAGVMRDLGAAMDDPHFLGTPEEVSRVFTEAVREVAAIAALGFAGEPVPLLAIEKQKERYIVSFLGIWLGDAEDMHEMRTQLPAQAWNDGADLGQSTCILLNAAEVEGRGLKEAALSAAMLAMVFGAGSAMAGQTPTPAVAKKVSFSKQQEPERGEKLVVKSQRLVQTAPRLYRDVLSEQYEDIRVLVNIGGQRAYILMDGKVAFETPISSAATGHRTPRGTYTISEKVRSGKMSTIYKCPLPGWMRLGDTAVGMHQGDLPGYPASHGCIRMPLESALFIFDHVPAGSTVEVVDSWTPPAAPAAAAHAPLVATAN